MAGRGSGTVFLAGCNLGCCFCQNHDISHDRVGRKASPDDLAGIMLSLQEAGCRNINFVTPTHFTPLLIDAIVQARSRGLSLPIVWNCGGYESVETLKTLEGFVEIYMPDLKFMDPETAEELARAPDYPDIVRAALREMHRQVGDLDVDENGAARRGLLVRHLVLPGGLSGTREAVRFLAEEISKETYINVMDCLQKQR